MGAKSWLKFGKRGVVVGYITYVRQQWYVHTASLPILQDMILTYDATDRSVIFLPFCVSHIFFFLSVAVQSKLVDSNLPH
jgi:hypothetical protein